MDALIAVAKPPEGPEWFSTAEYCKRYNVCRSTAQSRLDGMAENGILDTWKGNTCGAGRISRFRFKPTPKTK